MTDLRWTQLSQAAHKELIFMCVVPFIILIYSKLTIVKNCCSQIIYLSLQVLMMFYSIFLRANAIHILFLQYTKHFEFMYETAEEEQAVKAHY